MSCRVGANAADNPISEDEDYRVEVLVAVEGLERLDKDKFTEDEHEEASRIRSERIQLEKEEQEQEEQNAGNEVRGRSCLLTRRHNCQGKCREATCSSAFHLIGLCCFHTCHVSSRNQNNQEAHHQVGQGETRAA